MPGRVVLVHSDPPTLRASEDALGAAGFDVLAFDDPMAALAWLETEPVHLLATQIRMGIGRPSGVALARITRLWRPRTRIVLLSWAADRVHAEEIGAFLEAPFDPADLVDVVTGLLPAQKRA